ncbi:CMGC/SRPK protein kinase [Macrolepiota fuliginosa MF-IS2]|uniref:non-specific serine/threonine protein kinase n=1 Tax=Macrolepiota fuliginosa MF-IS2 TaxID=1400762 RepID=A0A9P5XAQ1_9AGAR|nr:CMGC/SRPK protein kinase [Macrolepiota fuliginosa MF-IS2]
MFMRLHFPTTGFKLIESSQLIEEEEWEWYKPEEFYPVRIGEIFKSQYQVVGKLGYGAYGTTWLCRDLLDHKYITLKIGTPKALEGELRALNYLKTIKTKNPASLLVRRLLDEFQVDGEKGKFQCVVHPPLATSVAALRSMFPGRAIPINLTKLILVHLLLSLNFFHTEAKMVHTDIQESNILLGMNEETTKQDLNNFEKAELTSPTARKVDGSRVIYISRPLVPPRYDYGRPVLCDFGEARFGEYDNSADIQPYQYRAPEVIFDIPWDEKVDIWSVGAMVNLGPAWERKFVTGGPENIQDTVFHLAHMIALLGPPPKDFLRRTTQDRLWGWFDENGNWRGGAVIPKGNLEDAEKQLQGEEKVLFLNFARRMLKWKPEERSSAGELLSDPWLNMR